ncbi:hypothetical protein PRIPAC_96298 [Pristionchus pacificus]|uniref:Fucosyltransferase n=1 Tax=Pristionchus pacificus TaxID=54126 RepID=A0A2A6B375_PRIPA|nr:hypothetical protein PRIPAC_96298 [Pristionchus pacificus]|eukprot:PDM60320.1 hypothetical protein PRIPAC_54145 [Pristionchus pacificus]
MPRQCQVYRNGAFVAAGLFLLYIIYSFLAPIGPIRGGIRSAQLLKQSSTHLLTVEKSRMDARFDRLGPKKADLPVDAHLRPLRQRFRCRLSRIRVTIRFRAGASSNAIDRAWLTRTPENRIRAQRYVFMTMEAPANTFGRLPKDPEQRLLPNNYFNWTMTPLFTSDMSSRNLMLYFNVTIVGGCATTNELKQRCPKGRNCDEEISKYAFVFAGENTACTDYVSEKYWSSNLPPKSVIALDDFESPAAMGDFIWKLVNNKAAYAQYFAWRGDGWTIARLNSEGYRNGYCKLCERLWEEEQTEKVVGPLMPFPCHLTDRRLIGASEGQKIPDVKAWYDRESSCDDGSFVRKWIGVDG